MNGIERIAAERKRQIEEEGWTDEHDDGHTSGQIALAAMCYAAPHRVFEQRVGRDWVAFVDPWPWDSKWDKRPGVECSIDKRIRALEKAGALCAAEIDRLRRKWYRDRGRPDAKAAACTKRSQRFARSCTVKRLRQIKAQRIGEEAK